MESQNLNTADEEPRHFNITSGGKKRKLFSYLESDSESKGFNLAGRPTHLKNINQGIKKLK